MSNSVDQQALDQIFLKASTLHAFQDKKVPQELLEKIYDTIKFAPTCFNCQPLRVVYVQSEEGKSRLYPNLMGGNVKQSTEAPVNAILAYDTQFFEHLDRLCPAYDAKSLYVANESWQVPTASLNANLQAGYFILGARALGVDVGPMTGANFAGIDEEFLKNSTFKSFLVVNIGYGKPEGKYPRAPRFTVDEAVQFV